MDQLDETQLHELVGGRADLMREWQFRWLIDHGLTPASRLLDLGCGTLRGGRAFIEYLDAGCYVGVEPQADYLAASATLLAAWKLLHMGAELLGLDQLDQFDTATFDYVLTQSVLNHLDRAGIETTVARVAAALKPQGKWLTTLLVDADAAPVQLGEPHGWRTGEWKSTRVQPAWFLALCVANGLQATCWPDRLHPAGLMTAVFVRAD